MKFTYTHITKDYTEITEYKVNKNNKIKSKIMYETLEHWKQYKQEKALQAKIAKEFKLFDNSTKLVSEYDKASFDKWMSELVTKNGTTKY